MSVQHVLLRWRSWKVWLIRTSLCFLVTHISELLKNVTSRPNMNALQKCSRPFNLFTFCYVTRTDLKIILGGILCGPNYSSLWSRRKILHSFAKFSQAQIWNVYCTFTTLSSLLWCTWIRCRSWGHFSSVTLVRVDRKNWEIVEKFTFQQAMPVKMGEITVFSQIGGPAKVQT